MRQIHKNRQTDRCWTYMQVQEKEVISKTAKKRAKKEEVEAVLSKAAKKKAKKQRQKDRHCPLQQVEGVGQGLDQEQVPPATTRLFTKCYVEGCEYNTSHQLGEEQVPRSFMTSYW